MFLSQNIKYYIVSIFALLFVFLANNTAFANEKENIFLSQNSSKVKFAGNVGIRVTVAARGAWQTIIRWRGFVIRAQGKK